MRRPLVFLAFALLALSAAACAASTGPGWTYAPPTAPPPSQPAPSAEASAAPSTEASVAPSQGSGGATGGVVQISALNIAYEQSDVTAPANTAFTIHFNNKDAGVPHNVEIKDASGMVMFKGDIITGPTEVDYAVPALAPGSYQFVCSVHPNMVGTLTVGG